MPELAQVLGAAPRGRAVVDRDLGDTLACGALDGDRGDAAATQRLDRDAESRAAADEHDRVDRRALDADRVSARLAGVGEQQQAGAERRDALGDAVEHLDLHGIEERRTHPLLEHDADDARAAAPQRPGARVGSGVAEFGGRGEHPLLRGIRHRARAAERERGGRCRDAGACRDVGERGSCGRIGLHAPILGRIDSIGAVTCLGHLVARRRERLDAATDLVLGVRRRQLHADARRAAGHHREAERRHVHAALLQRVGDARRERGVAEHDGHDRVLAGQQVEALGLVMSERNSAAFAFSCSRSAPDDSSSSSACSVPATIAGASVFEKRYGRARWRSSATISARAAT